LTSKTLASLCFISIHLPHQNLISLSNGLQFSAIEKFELAGCAIGDSGIKGNFLKY